MIVPTPRVATQDSNLSKEEKMMEEELFAHFEMVAPFGPQVAYPVVFPTLDEFSGLEEAFE